MNANQTKLTKDQKRDVRIVLDDFGADGGHVFSFPDLGATVACKPKFPGANQGDFAIAVMGADETKFRKLVGIDVALHRFNMGQTLTLELHDDIDVTMEGRAQEFAEFVVF